uniref:Glycosyltransferase n=1 Tax=Schlesneria paludicola TaxID=360056 RepID=A0A7C4LJE9_9PLAN
MKGFPPVSAMCLTYGRPHLLEEAIQSFLLQDYPGPKELVVLNDFADQTLVCDHAEVRVINTAQRFPTVGEKRNACATLARHDILFVWDDDDLYLPWRLSLSIRRLDESKGFYKCPRAWMLNNGQLEGPTTNLYHSAACFTRDLFERAGCYPHIGSGQDWGLEDAIKRLIPAEKDDHALGSDELYYIYRWQGTGSYHLSAFGRDEGRSVPGQAKVAEFVQGQVREGKILTGMVRLKPAWREDYLGMARSKVGTPATSTVITRRDEPLPMGASNAPSQDTGDCASSSNPSATSSRVAPPIRPAEEKSPPGPPLVSCIMPTYGRPDYVAESIAMFLAQDYPAKELIILNDCPGQKLAGEFPDVRIVNVDARWPTLGEKRNAAIELARGDYIAVWDDDDIYLPWRLSHGMQRIRDLQAPLYCPAEYWAYWGSEDLHDNRALLNWIYHPLVIFRKELWQAVGGYPAQTLSEDTAFFKKILEHLGIDWPSDPVNRCDRVMILRGKSKYTHTSIAGGRQAPDIEPRSIQLAPCGIQDAALRQSVENLIKTRESQATRRAMAAQALQSWLDAASDSGRMFLDQLRPVGSQVGYGTFGVSGDLGYEGKRVEVCGQVRNHALSTHGSARVIYDLNGRFSRFCCQVAMNDDVPADVTAADFLVLADGRVTGIARNVRPHQIPRLLTADVSGVRELELVVRPRRWEYCHSVWVDPFLVVEDGTDRGRAIPSALNRAEILPPAGLPRVEQCIATVGSPGYEEWIDDLLGSVCANAQCPDALLAIFFLGESPRIREVADKDSAVVIPCRPWRALNAACKSVLYSAGQVINAEKFICLDADVLVLDDLRPIFAAIDAVPEGSVLASRNAGQCLNLAQALQVMYGGQTRDADLLLGCDASAALKYPLVVNDGLFAGTRSALCGLDDLLRGMTRAADWVDDATVNKPWRNQFVYNLAMAQAEAGIELDSRYNIHLHFEPIEFRGTPLALEAGSEGRRAAVVHFDGYGKGKFPEQRGR